MTGLAAPGSEGRRRAVGAARRRNPNRPRWWVVLAFLSPFLVGLAVFQVYPVFAVLYYSFTNFQAGSTLPVKLVGLRNYVDLFQQSTTFWTAVRNTIWMVVVLVPAQTIWGIFTAWVLTRIRRGSSIYRTIYFLPAMVPVVASALAFVLMLNPAGPVNTALGHLGISGPGWFGDPSWSKPSLVLVALWAVGNTMILFLAGMLDVPRSLYEAAEIDGAGGWSKFWHVTLPGISPVIFFVVLIGLIYTFQYFTEAYVASGATNSQVNYSASSLGYPQQSLLFYSTELYRQGFVFFKTGVASAMAWLLFLAIFVCTIVFIRGSRRFVYYAGGMR